MTLDKADKDKIRKRLDEIDRKHQLIVQKRQDYLMNCLKLYYISSTKENA